MNGKIEVENKIETRIKNNLIGCPDYLYDWYMNLKANNNTPATCYDYVNKVKQMLLSYGGQYPSIKQLSQRHTIEYFDSVQKITDRKGNVKYSSSSYQQTVWCALSNFFEYLYKTQMIANNYMETIKRPKNKDEARIEQERILLTQRDFSKILKAVDKGVGNSTAKKLQAKTKTRDKLILYIFMTTGMRKTALSEINLEDIDLKNKSLRIIDKGNKYHVYTLSDQMVNHFNEWLQDRDLLLHGRNSSALFISDNGQRLTGNAIAKIVLKYSEGGLGYHISPHKLRAGFCSILFSEKHDIEFVRKAVGHSRIQTTQRYIVTNNNERKEASEIISNLLNF